VLYPVSVLSIWARNTARRDKYCSAFEGCVPRSFERVTRNKEIVNDDKDAASRDTEVCYVR